MAGSGTAHLRNDDTVLRVEHLVMEFPARRGQVVHAVSDLSFDLLRGETLGIVGESGCGKTTAGQAVACSGLLAARGGLAEGNWGLAIYGKLVEASQVLGAGDRVEILRALRQDPKTRRRDLARRGRTAGKSSAGGRGD